VWVILTFMVTLGVSALTFALVRPREGDRFRAPTTSILAMTMLQLSLHGHCVACSDDPLRLKSQK
jgi:hypothetical protein